MANHFIDTPRTERGDATRYDSNLDFSEEVSFRAPAGRDALFPKTRTPRNPLATIRNPAGRTEFTPMMKSATTNRMKQMNGLKGKGLATPAGLKPGFEVGGTPLPEASTLDVNSSSFSMSGVDGRTPVPEVSSSAMSTPLALPRRAEGELDNGNGNVLTLREQEARLEQIDKENFGLKLKIHFLEENLRKMGPEFNKLTMEENVNLKSEKVHMTRDLHKYSKSLKNAESELESYRQQLKDYAEKVKRRHADEDLQEVMEELRRTAEERADEIQTLQRKLKSAQDDEDELEELRRLADERENEIEELQEKLNQGKDESDELKERAQEIESLEQKLAEFDSVQKELETVNAQLEKAQAEIADRDQQLDDDEDEIDRLKQELEARDADHGAAGSADVEEMQRQLATLTEEVSAKASRIAQLEVISHERDGLLVDVANLRSELGTRESDALELQKELASRGGKLEAFQNITRERDALQADVKSLQAEVRKQEQQVLDLQDDVQVKSKDSAALEGVRDERDVAQDSLSKLRQEMSNIQRDHGEATREARRERDRLAADKISLEATIKARDEEVGAMQHKLTSLSTSLGCLAELKSDLSDRMRELETARRTITEKEAELDALRLPADEPGTQLDAMQDLVRTRDTDLEALREEMNKHRSEAELVKRLAEEQLEQLRGEVDKMKREKHEQGQSEASAKREEVASLQHLADERLDALSKLRQQAQQERQDLEDEIDVLQEQADEASDEKASLNAKIASLEGLVRDLEDEVRSMRTELRKTQSDHDKILQQKDDRQKSGIDFLQRRVYELQDQLKNKDADYLALKSMAMSPHARASEEQSRAKLEQRISSLQSELQEVGKQDREREMKDKAALREHKAEFERQVQHLERLVHEKDLKLQAAQKSSRLAQQKLADGQLDYDQALSMRKTHGKEINGLAKQIQYLRARCARADNFRAALGYQKRFFLMQIEVYNQCNQEDLNLISAMGITPDVTMHAKKPTLRAAALAIIAVQRMQKLREMWAANVNIHSQLAYKLEGMRRGPARAGLHGGSKLKSTRRA